jgi:transcriptional regulator with XRE-family HTH domain
MTSSNNFASSVRHLREAAGMSQEELGDSAGLDRTFISQLERGLKSPTLNTLDKVAACLGISATRLIGPALEPIRPVLPRDYVIRDDRDLSIQVSDNRICSFSSRVAIDAINATHAMIDQLYGADLDIASVLGMRNLSSFIGELYAAGLKKTAGNLFQSNPHQDGYPDLLFMDEIGQSEWDRLLPQRKEKAPFSPFPGGGVEVKATCGSVPTPAACAKKGLEKPGIGDTRIGVMDNYDWKAHHRDTNNLIGILWDFINERPRIAAVFYSSELEETDWSPIVVPKAKGGRTTSVSILKRPGIVKMFEGWICVVKDGGYREFINRRNRRNGKTNSKI